MKKFVVNILLFGLIFGILYLLLLRLTGVSALHGNVSFVEQNYGHLDARMEEIGRQNEGDILFLGSSHCYRSFDPRCYPGLKVFNLGSSNQTPVQTLALLQSYLDGLNPKRVIFEVHPDIMANTGEESAVDVLSNCAIDRNVSRMAWSYRSMRVVNTWLYAMMKHGLNRPVERGDDVVRVATKVNGEDVMCDFTYVEGGFVELPLLCYQPQEAKPHSFRLEPRQLEALQQCLQLIAEKEIPVMLVETPASRNYYSSYTNHRDFELLMAEQGLYLNLNEADALMDRLDDRRHFFDEDHLNQDGVQLLNEYLRICILSD